MWTETERAEARNDGSETSWWWLTATNLAGTWQLLSSLKPLPGASNTAEQEALAEHPYVHIVGSAQLDWWVKSFRVWHSLFSHNKGLKTMYIKELGKLWSSLQDLIISPSELLYSTNTAICGSILHEGQGQTEAHSELCQDLQRGYLEVCVCVCTCSGWWNLQNHGETTWSMLQTSNPCTPYLNSPYSTFKGCTLPRDRLHYCCTCSLSSRRQVSVGMRKSFWVSTMSMRLLKVRGGDGGGNWKGSVPQLPLLFSNLNLILNLDIVFQVIMNITIC